MTDKQPTEVDAAMLNNWTEQARAHWKEFQPSYYRDLVRVGKLEKALTDAVERTGRELIELEAMGFYRHEAWEIVRESYLFTPEEGKPWSHNDSPFWRPT
jgi:hypothetical protein